MPVAVSPRAAPTLARSIANPAAALCFTCSRMKPPIGRTTDTQRSHVLSRSGWSGKGAEESERTPSRTISVWSSTKRTRPNRFVYVVKSQQRDFPPKLRRLFLRVRDELFVRTLEVFDLAA